MTPTSPYEAAPALVLGLSETGLGVCRALGREGIRAFGFDVRRRKGFRSRHVTARSCPDPSADERAFVACLLEFAGRFADPPVLMVTNDRFVAAVASCWSQLAGRFRMLLPPPSVVGQLLDKAPLYECCLRHGIPVPRSVYAREERDLASLARDLSFPVFIKPSSSSMRRVFGGPGKGRVANDLAEASQVVREVASRGGDAIVQEIVAGPDHDAYKYCACYSEAGRPLVEFTLRKLRLYPSGFGVGCCCESVSAPDVAELGRRLFSAVGYRGVGSIEFKRDSRDGQLKLIEVNARYWQQISLATACGVNVPAAHYLEATGRSSPAPGGQRPGTRWISPDLDSRTSLESRLNGTLTYAEWRRTWRGPLVLSDFEWSDPWPLLGSGRTIPAAARLLSLFAGFPWR